MKRFIAYILGIAGLALVAASYPTVRTTLGITVPEGMDDLYLMILGIALVIVGAFLAFRKGKREEEIEEVPIYKGKKVVGYRRH